MPQWGIVTFFRYAAQRVAWTEVEFGSKRREAGAAGRRVVVLRNDLRVA